MQFLDTVALSGVTQRDDGFLVADAFTARTGIQLYAGIEVGRPDLPVVRVYRDASEVFSHSSLASFSHIPITLDHPAVAVNSENWADLAVGETSTEVLREGERLKLPLIIKKQDAIDAVKSGKRQLSVGYDCVLDWTSGTHDGVQYQARQRDIRANHVAIVDVARAGPEFKIGDANWATPLGDTSMTNMPIFKSVVIDGITIQTTDQGAEAIAKLQTKIAELTTDNVRLSGSVGEKDKEIGTLKIDLQKLKDTPPPNLDKLAADRAALIETARGIAKDLKVDGLDSNAVRRAAVLSAFGEAMVKDASDAQIEGMFLAAAVTKRDPVTDALRSSAATHTPAITADHGQAAYEERLRNSWKTGKAA
jgi:hypothetical protein